jgi:FAD/FMN-containing dehydrogenase
VGDVFTLHTRDLGKGTILMRVAELRAVLNGQLVSPNDVGYDVARRIWNGAIDHRPALIVRCASVADVQATVRTVTEHRLPVSVRGDGYDWAGRSVRDDGMVIDLSAMRRVTVGSSSSNCNATRRRHGR